MAIKSKVKPKLALGELTPEQFENLIYDLVTSLGLRNVNWRTPGADGGRDIEADEIAPDFSGVHVSKRWFIECKRYKSSVDWPTIYGKLAYADSFGADYLLMCTPSKYTPAAISQTEAWNSKRRDLQVRLWPGHVLEQQLQAYPDILSKFGLAGLPTTPGRSLVSLALALSKTVATYRGSLIFSDASSDPMLEAAQAFASLLTQRIGDVEQAGRIQPSLHAIADGERWSVAGKPFKIDAFALGTFLCYLSALTRTSLTVEGTGDYSCQITLDATQKDVLSRYRPTFDAICLWGEMEYRVDGLQLRLTQRTGFYGLP